jgi:hypothetical protein
MRVADMTVLPMPVDLPIWGLASLKVTRSELRDLLGNPHFVETDPRLTCGGERDAWAYALPNGLRVLVILDVTVSCAELFGDPPELAPVLFALGIPPDDSRLVAHAEPWELK